MMSTYIHMQAEIQVQPVEREGPWCTLIARSPVSVSLLLCSAYVDLRSLMVLRPE